MGWQRWRNPEGNGRIVRGVVEDGKTRFRRTEACKTALECIKRCGKPVFQYESFMELVVEKGSGGLLNQVWHVV